MSDLELIPENTSTLEKSEILCETGLPDSFLPLLDFEIRYGREELNFAEFPICIVGKRSHVDQNTITYKDQLWDVGGKTFRNRSLEITGCKKYGLPTTTDSEVLLALQQLGYVNKFQEQKVDFSIYHIIQVLGWPMNGKSHKRVEDSLNRWLGVTFRYVNAWRERNEQEDDSWSSKGFHVIDNLELVDQEQSRKGKLSSFKWNDEVFKNLNRGHHKSINLGEYRLLESPTAKRMYQFLDKRFYHGRDYECDFETFVLDKVGICRNQPYISAMKRGIRSALLELEAIGYIDPLEENERIFRNEKGWRIKFKKCASGSLPVKIDKYKESVTNQLISFGITPNAAKKLTSQYELSFVEQKINELQFLLSQKDHPPIKNTGAYLRESIIHKYETPVGYMSPAQLEELEKEKEARKAAREEQARKAQLVEEERRRKEEEDMKIEQKLVSLYLEALTPEEYNKLVENALEPFGDTPLNEAFKRGAIFIQVQKILSAANSGIDKAS